MRLTAATTAVERAARATMVFKLNNILKVSLLAEVVSVLMFGDSLLIDVIREWPFSQETRRFL